MRIDEKSLVPLGWVISGFGAMASVIIVGSLWVSAVNYRLGRIEEKLGIPGYRAGAILPESAYATEKQNVNGK